MKRLAMIWMFIVFAAAVAADAHSTNRLLLNPYRGFGEIRGIVAADGIILKNDSSGAKDYLAALPKSTDELKADIVIAEDFDRRFVSGLRARKDVRWSVLLADSVARVAEIEFRVRQSEENEYAGADSLIVSCGGRSFSEPVRWGKFSRHVRIRIVFRDGRVIVGLCGKDFSFPVSVGLCSKIGLRLPSGKGLLLKSIKCETGRDPGCRMTEWTDQDKLKEYLKRSADPLEGIWTLYGSTLEDTLLRMGGDYRLALVCNGNGYDIIYLSGAAVGRDRWQRGMIKGHLVATDFGGVYGLVWYDAEMKRMDHELKAQTEEFGNVLRLYFPYQDSSVVLRKVTPSAE